MNQKFIIKDIDQFTLSLRKLVFGTFGVAKDVEPDGLASLIKDIPLEQVAEMDEVLTQKESMSIVMENVIIEEENLNPSYMITEQTLHTIVENLNSRLVSNLLLSLSKKGFIETAYDTDIDDFVFWVKEIGNNNDNNNKTDSA